MVRETMQMTNRVRAGPPTFLLCLIFILISASGAASGLELFPEAELVASSVDSKVSSRKIFLGPLKKINNQLEPESVEFVSGVRESSTFYIPNETRVSKVVEFYRHQLHESVRILFECRGRDCGSSNYWANTVFNMPVLYGPEQYQHYLVGRGIDQLDYISIYVGQRGTKKIYVHIETTTFSSELPSVDEVAVSAALTSQGRYVITLAEDGVVVHSTIEAIAQSLDRHHQISLTLVAHDALREGETIGQGQQRTLDLAEAVRSDLVAAGVATNRLSAYGVGPLSPLGEEESSRLELLVIRRAPVN
jgi:Domain of unknown function (DUF4892)